MDSSSSQPPSSSHQDTEAGTTPIHQGPKAASADIVARESKMSEGHGRGQSSGESDATDKQLLICELNVPDAMMLGFKSCIPGHVFYAYQFVDIPEFCFWWHDCRDVRTGAQVDPVSLILYNLHAA